MRTQLRLRVEKPLTFLNPPQKRELGNRKITLSGARRDCRGSNF